MNREIEKLINEKYPVKGAMMLHDGDYLNALHRQAAHFGYSLAEGAFAEWCSKNGWEYSIHFNGWLNYNDCEDEATKTTSDLFTLFKQSLKSQTEDGSK